MKCKHNILPRERLANQEKMLQGTPEGPSLRNKNLEGQHKLVITRNQAKERNDVHNHNYHKENLLSNNEKRKKKNTLCHSTYIK